MASTMKGWIGSEFSARENHAPILCNLVPVTSAARAHLGSSISEFAHSLKLKTVPDRATFAPGILHAIVQEMGFQSYGGDDIILLV